MESRLKPLIRESAVGSNYWYEVVPSSFLPTTVFEYDWSSCKQIKVLGEFEKDFSLRNGINYTPWEMIFLESPIYGVAGLSTTKTDQPVTCSVSLYFMMSEWYGTQTAVLFDLGKKDVLIPAKPLPIITTPSQGVIPEKKLKTLLCIKGKLTKKVTAVNPKCPAGYKVKR